ncbi:MAG: response regulator transcription factor [Candidatus Eiseniibacteriota bacterium]|jgi:two-component system response regulator RegX3
MKILIVEDEPGLRGALTDLLKGDGHFVEAVGDGRDAIECGVDPSIDLVLLDLMLPGVDGVEVCKALRARRPELYILMLTARGSEDSKVTGLGAGADDYVTKPFGARELLARVGAVARRLENGREQPEAIEIDGCRLDLGRCRAERDGETITLTAREASILRLLHQHRARAVTRGELLERVWGSPGDLQTRTVDMTIANLRQKIEREPSQPCIVVTVKGVGYSWGQS